MPETKESDSARVSEPDHGTVGSYDPTAAIASIAKKERLAQATLDRLRHLSFDPANQKLFNRTWTISQLQSMVGRAPQTIRDAENEGRLPAPEKDASNRRRGYTLPELNHMRDIFGTRPHRAEGEDTPVIAFSNFKGGAGKSTLAVHFAQYMALKGYRMLLVDSDPQASATTMFGINSDLEADQERALENYLFEDFDDFRRCIRTSYFPGVDIVPANLRLFNAEYALAAHTREDPLILNRLKTGIGSVKSDYDVIVIDPPPALGMLSLSVINAATALIIPMRPSTVDFASTAAFLSMLKSNLTSMIGAGFQIQYYFESLLINNMDDNKSAHKEISETLHGLFPAPDIFTATMKDSAEIDNAARDMKTVYDLSRPLTSKATHQRCLDYLNAVNLEIETRVRKIWPSHREALRKQAII
ncbi:MAG: AAA family ATPase [Woeseiaceae bacterium]|nr:AAA family ATPase [Woeseiaceae bacterium]